MSKMGVIVIRSSAGCDIRFVEKYPGDWWAVLSDVSKVLGLKAFKVRQRLSKDLLSKYTLQTSGGPQEMITVSEFGIYETVFESRKKEAKEFKRWVLRRYVNQQVSKDSKYFECSTRKKRTQFAPNNGLSNDIQSLGIDENLDK
ncbi:BRO family protein [Paenibacillus sp. DS2363]